MAAAQADAAVGAAEAYEQHLVPKIFGPWAALAVDLAAPAPGEAVLDAACGTGIGVRLAAPLKPKHLKPKHLNSAILSAQSIYKERV